MSTLQKTVLSVKHFSSIDHASLSLSRLTILIGPQATGKSVLSKLIYYFYDILDIQPRFFDEDTSVDNLLAHAVEQFKKMFPPSAWGSEKFTINFSAGPYSAKITRRPSRNRPSENIKLTLSPNFIEQYQFALDEYNSLIKTDRALQTGRYIFRL